MKQQIEQARWIAVMVATAIALYLCWLMLRPFIGVLEWAVVLVIVFYPVHKRLAGKIKRRGLTALLSCFLVVLVVVLPLTNPYDRPGRGTGKGSSKSAITTLGVI